MNRGTTAAPRRIDIPGVVTSALALFALTFALIEGHDRGWTSPVILGCFAVAALLGIVFVQLELRVAEPMVAMSLFRERVFSGGLIALVMWGFGLFGIYFFTSLYLQGVLGFSPTEAGAAFVPMALLMAASAVLSERVSHRLGAHRVVGGGNADDGHRHRVGQPARLRGRLLVADAQFRGDRDRRRADRAADGERARCHATRRGRRRVRNLQRLPRGVRAARASPSSGRC